MILQLWWTSRAATLQLWTLLLAPSPGPLPPQTSPLGTRRLRPQPRREERGKHVRAPVPARNRLTHIYLLSKQHPLVLVYSCLWSIANNTRGKVCEKTTSIQLQIRAWPVKRTETRQGWENLGTLPYYGIMVLPSLASNALQLHPLTCTCFASQGEILMGHHGIPHTSCRYGQKLTEKGKRASEEMARSLYHTTSVTKDPQICPFPELYTGSHYWCIHMHTRTL